MFDRITIAIPYYEAPEMLRTQLSYWRKYPQVIANQVNVVLVDDGSPNYPAQGVLESEELPRVNISLYRIEENIPWNVGGAKNLAMQMAPEGWVVLTDIDHVVPVLSIVELLKCKLDERYVYRTGRQKISSNGEYISAHPHTDSFILTRDKFLNHIGGFDEDLTGYWNGPFLPFRKQVQKCAYHIKKLLHIKMILYDRDTVSDANVTEWSRNGGKYDIRNNLEMRRKQRKAIANYKPKNPLRFTWRKIGTYQR